MSTRVSRSLLPIPRQPLQDKLSPLLSRKPVVAVTLIDAEAGSLSTSKRTALIAFVARIEKKASECLLSKYTVSSWHLRDKASRNPSRNDLKSLNVSLALFSNF